MARKYTKVEQLAEIVRERHNQGETYREIATGFGQEKKQLRQHRTNPKKRQQSLCFCDIIGAWISR